MEVLPVWMTTYRKGAHLERWVFSRNSQVSSWRGSGNVSCVLLLTAKIVVLCWIIVSENTETPVMAGPKGKIAKP